jgi:hypothetical protein
LLHCSATGITFELRSHEFDVTFVESFEQSPTYNTNLALEIDAMFIVDCSYVELVARDGQRCTCCSEAG